MTRRGRGRRGFTMFELVVAAGLTLMVLTGAGMVVSNTERISTTTRTRDTAVALGIATLEKSRAFGCGLSPAPGVSANAAAARCADAYGGQPQALDATFTSTDTSGRTFTVTSTSRWRVIGAGDACPSTSDAPVPATLPQLLERRVQLEWTSFGATQQAEFTALSATPGGYAYSGIAAGGLAVYVSQDKTPVSVTSSTDPSLVTLTRFASLCTGGPSGAPAVAWFPFLPAGVYQVSVGTGGGASVTVTQGQLTSQVRTGAA